MYTTDNADGEPIPLAPSAAEGFLIRRTHARSSGQFRNISRAIAMERSNRLHIELQSLNVIVERFRIRHSRFHKRWAGLWWRRKSIVHGQDLFLRYVPH